MSYTAEISRANPSLFLFLIDQSGSMDESLGSGDTVRKKAEELADVMNRTLFELTLKCAKDEGVRDYYEIGIIGYGDHVAPAFAGSLTGRELVPISELGNMPARVEDRVKRVNDGAGGLVDQSIKFPIWIDPIHSGGTPMCQAFSKAKSILSSWIGSHSNSFPPIVINITDGASTDGDPSEIAKGIASLSTGDGSVLVFNIHLSSSRATKIEYPSSVAGLPDEYAQLLFNISSPLTGFMKLEAQKDGMNVTDGAKGFVFNADLVSLIKFLDIGTRPSNLR
jgi:hypothetical protein